MKPRVLFVITGDPRQSPRPAEAIRIAAGVAAWRKVEISLYLRDAAVLALAEFVDDLVDEDHYSRFLPILGEVGSSIYVQANAPLLEKLGASALRFAPISDEELADLTARQNYLLRF